MKRTFRASELDRILSCPGSMRLTAIVRAREGDDGLEGETLHALSARRFIAELGASGEAGNDPGSNISFSKWISDYYVRHVADTAPVDWSLEVESGLAYSFDRFVLSGHIDCLALSPDATEAIGWDLKTGYNPVDAADSSEQAFGYFGLLKRAYPALRKLTFYIVQPRNDEDDGYERVSRMVLEATPEDPDKMERALATLEARINAAIDDDLTLNTGIKQCKFCVGCSCPAIREDQKTMKMKLTPEILATIKETPDDAVLGDFVAVGRLLSKPLEDATAMLYERLDNAGVVVAGNGTTITRKTVKGSYEILEPVPLYKAAKELLVEDDRMAAAFSPSMTRITDQVAEKLAIPKSGRAPITAQGIVDAQIKCFTRQNERRILSFNA